MKFNKWTLGLAAVGVVSLASVAKAEETMSMVKTAVSGTTISGYVDTSVEWAVCPSHTTLGDQGWNYSSFFSVPFRQYKQDGFNLNSVGITIEKPLDETPWASGYKVQLVYGPDGNSLLGEDMPIKQAYVTLRVPVGNGIVFKIGQFDTIIGYEVFEAGNNPNFTRSFGWGIEPTEHTGILASYQINDSIAVSAGVANSLSAGINTIKSGPGNRYSKDAWDKTGLASITLTAPQSWGFMAGSSFSSGIVYGMDSAYGDNSVNIYAGLTVPTPIKGLAFGASFDYKSSCYDGSYDYYGPEKQSVEAYAFALYGTWQATEKLSLNLRGEYAHEDYNDSYYFYDSFDGFGKEQYRYQADVFSLTATLQYNLWANVISRLELRYDALCQTDHTSGNDEFGHYSYGYSYPSVDQLSLYLNIIYKF